MVAVMLSREPRMSASCTRSFAHDWSTSSGSGASARPRVCWCTNRTTSALLITPQSPSDASTRNSSRPGDSATIVRHSPAPAVVPCAPAAAPCTEGAVSHRRRRLSVLVSASRPRSKSRSTGIEYGTSPSTASPSLSPSLLLSSPPLLLLLLLRSGLLLLKMLLRLHQCSFS